MAKRNRPITVWRKSKKGGRIGNRAFISNKTGRLRKSNRFTAEFVTDRDFDLYLDSRHLQKKIGDTLKPYFERCIMADVHPENGQANPLTYRTKGGQWRQRDTSNAQKRYMVRNLHRTIVSTNTSWGGGGKRISYARTRMKFYFDEPNARLRNYYDRWRSRDRAFYLGLGGRVRPMIDKKVGEWMDLVIEGHRFQWPPDSKSDAWG